MNKTHTALERRMMDEIINLQTRLTKLEERTGVAEEAIHTVQERNGTTERVLSERLETETRAKESADALLKGARVDDQQRIERLEAVFKQADFERKEIAEKFTRGLEGVRSE